MADNFDTMGLMDRLKYFAQVQPESRAMAWINGSCEEIDSLTYGQLMKQARALATHLLLHWGASPGDRVLLVFLPGLDFARAFVGCLLANVVPVPVYPPHPSNPKPAMEKLIAACKLSGPKIALCDSLFASAKRIQILLRRGPAYPKHLTWKVISAQVLTTKNITSKTSLPNKVKMIFRSGSKLEPKSNLEEIIGTYDEDALAFIQFTSGSTGDPKGVMISRRALDANLRAHNQTMGTTIDQVGFSWAPHYHDMGLISCLFHNLFVGAFGVYMSPVTFLQRPIVWLQAVHKYRANLSPAPNFAFDLVARKATKEEVAALDLSCCTRWGNGGEPVRADTLRRFVEKFQSAGVTPESMSPTYGAAENVILMAARHGAALAPVSILRIAADSLTSGMQIVLLNEDDDNQGQPVVEVVSNGRPAVSVGVWAVHEGEPVEQGTVGELWITGESKALGYYGRPEASHETFFSGSITLPNGSQELCYKTGDLGFIFNDEVYVCGRIKDLIILNGANVYPQDVEETVYRSNEKVLRGGCIAAFQIDEKVAVIAELRSGKSRSRLNAKETDKLKSVAETIREAVRTNHGFLVGSIVLIEPKTITKTTSGKVKRSKCKDDFLSQNLRIVYHLKSESNDDIDVSGVGSSEDDEHLDVEYWVQKGAEWIRGYRINPDLMRQRMTLLSLSTIPELMNDPTILPLLSESQDMDPFVDEIVSGLLEYAPLVSKWIAKLMRDFEANKIPGVEHKEDIIPSLVDMVHWIVLLDALTIRLCADTTLLMDTVLPAYILRKNRSEEHLHWFDRAKLQCLFAANYAMNGDVKDPASGTDAMNSIRQNILLAVRGALSSAFDRDVSVPNARIGQAIADSIVDGILPNEFDRPGGPNTAAHLFFPKESCELYRAWNAGFVLLWSRSLFLTRLLSVLVLPKSMLACPTNLYIQHRIVSLLLALITSLPSIDEDPSLIEKETALTLRAQETIDTVVDIGNRLVMEAIQSLPDIVLSTPEEVSTTATQYTASCLVSKLGTMELSPAGSRAFLREMHKLDPGNQKLDTLRQQIADQKNGRNDKTDQVHCISKTPPPPQLSSEDAEVWLCHRIADFLVLSCDSVAPTDDLLSLGMTSINTPQLVSHLEKLGRTDTLPMEFLQQHQTPRELVIGLRELNKGTPATVFPEIHIPRPHLTSSPSLHWTIICLLQFIGAMGVWALMAIAVLPSYWFGHWVQYDLKTQPWSWFSVGTTRVFGLLLPMLIPLWMGSFTLLVLLCKWVVIGRYHDQTALKMDSLAFIRWWWIDRLMNVWEQFVGHFIMGTQLLHAVYKLLGADIAWSADLDSFVREFDLVSVGPDSSIHGSLIPRIFNADTKTIRFRRVAVGNRCRVSAEAVVLAGCVVADDVEIEPLCVLSEGSLTKSDRVYCRNPGRESQKEKKSVMVSKTLEWLPGCLFRLAAMFATLYGFFYLSIPVLMFWDPQRVGLPQSRYVNFVFWTTSPFVNGLLQLPIVVVLKWALVGRARLSADSNPFWKTQFAWIVDFQFRVVVFTTWRIVHDYFVTTATWLRAYGANVSPHAYFVPLHLFKPSQADLLSIGNNAFVSTARVQAVDGVCHGETKIDSYGEVGLRAVIGTGAKIGRGATIGPLTHIGGDVSIKETDRVWGSVVMINSKANTDQDRIEFNSFNEQHPEESFTDPTELLVSPVSGNDFLTVLFNMSVRIVLLGSFIVCLIPGYEVAYWLLFDSDLSREVAIICVSVSFPMSMVTIAVWSGLLTRFILGRNRFSTSFPCSASWYVLTQNIAGTNQQLLLPVLQGTAFMRVFCRLMGARVDSDAYIGTSHTLEHFMLDIGEGAIIDEGAYVWGHQMVKQKIHAGPVRLAANSVMHPGSAALPGSVVEGELRSKTLAAVMVLKPTISIDS